MTAFNYPDDAAAQWASYQEQVGFQGGGQAVSGGGLMSYVISGDDPPWRPLQAYTDGAKTYVEFPASNTYASAPVLEEWKSGCGLCVFRSPEYAVLNYRKISLPNGAIYYIADGVYDHLALISGVGNSQTIVRLDRPGG
jgi:type IV secretion system protein TrbG